MADRTIKVLEPATEFGLMTLDELKLALGIPSNDTSTDAQLEQMIDWYSAHISQLTNRVFAREKVRETWRDINDRRLFLSHWPVTEADIETVESPRGTLYPATDWELEEASGKLSLFGTRAEPIVVTYTGGYELPDDAPDDLKSAAVLLVQHGRAQAQREAAAGIRSISHKDSRVMFFDPNAVLTAQAKGGSGVDSTVQALLYHYSRLEV
jgi:hypothetical protein